MKKSLILVALLSLFVGFASCEKDDAAPQKETITPEPQKGEEGEQKPSDEDKKEEDKKDEDKKDEDDSKKEENKTIFVTFESAVLPECGYLKYFGKDESAIEEYDYEITSYAEQDILFESESTNWGESFFAYRGIYVSSTTDKKVVDYKNDFSVYANSGANGSKNFAVFYYSGKENSFSGVDMMIRDKNDASFTPKSVYLALTTYCFHSAFNAKNGIKKFTSEDFFELEIVGLNKDGEQVASQKIKIIDGENSDFIGWKKVEFDESFANVSKITFKTDSSQHNALGDIFPAYIALDDFEFVRE